MSVPRPQISGVIMFGLVMLRRAYNEHSPRQPFTMIEPDVQPTEEAVGRAMWAEIETAAKAKQGDLVILLLGGRGAQALHRLVGEKARNNEADEILKRLQVFTQMPWRQWP